LYEEPDIRRPTSTKSPAETGGSKVRWRLFNGDADPEKAKLTVSLRFGLDVTLLEVRTTGGGLLVGPVPEKGEGE
jgi:hypothetical protein